MVSVKASWTKISAATSDDRSERHLEDERFGEAQGALAVSRWAVGQKSCVESLASQTLVVVAEIGMRHTFRS